MSDRPDSASRPRPAPQASTADLAARIAQTSIHDATRLRRRLSAVRRLKGSARRRELAALSGRVDRAERRVETRRAAVPAVHFPAELPVSARVADLAAAIREHQVVVVAGETGSGKSTQLPKLCLQLGRGVRGLIGHTQPRRIAARTLAERIAEETETIVGGPIGYTIRFGDHTGPRTLVKLMTDGILLAEIASDPDLLRYDTIIIDEAHERSLNIDFLLGYLSRLLPRRPDLKLIITSATIDPQKFSRHFGGAPIVEVSGRTFPVEIRYRPYGPDEVGDSEDDDADGSGEGLAGGDGRTTHDGMSGRARSSIPATTGLGANVGQPTESMDQSTAIVRGVDELLRAGDASGRGDILIFLSGEREITDTAEVLRAHLQRRGGLARTIDVLPLYGRLSMADQHRVFAPSGHRRIILATNVAETSLTVPGVRYVIDPGTARISRYSTRTKVQRLPIEKISRASAGQRAGRCGRMADGICLRLYSESDFAGRDGFTDPEIARTSLASVILQMAALGLGDIASFPFLDPPDAKQISDGMTVLRELGALERVSGDGARSRGDVRLTDVGRSLAALPVDPRLARILVEGDRRGCLAEILVIVSALAIRDVREFPLDAREKAVQAHSRFADPTSDFVAFVGLWNYLRRRAGELSGNKFRRMCAAEYLHYLRIREWQDLHAQLRSAAAGLGMDVDSSRALPRETAKPPDREPEADRDGQWRKGSEAAAVDHEAVHTALAAGLLSHIGSRIEREAKSARSSRSPQRRPPAREYQGTRGSTFALWPGSALAKTGAPFVLAAELVETSRLWGRTVAAVDPAWVERVGGDLLRRQYSEPRFSGKRQAIVATEKVTLLGVTLVAGRTVAYDRIDPELARELLIRHGLVEGQLTLPLPFLAANQQALDEVVESERRARRDDIAVDDETLFALYDARLPSDATSGRRLEAWWRRASRGDPTILTFTPDMLIAAGARLVEPEQYPDRLTADGVEVDLDYVFDPGAANDGVSATVPLAALASIDPASLPAQVPGLRRELALALVKSLPKSLRRSFVPAPDYVDAALDRLGDGAGALPTRLADALSALGGIPVTEQDFDYSKVPDHLRMRFTVVDDGGRTVTSGTDLSAIQRRLRADTRHAVAKVSSQVERRGLTSFPPDGLPRETSGEAAGQTVMGYPAFVDDGDSVAVRVFADRADQARAMRAGTRRLIALTLRDAVTTVAGRVRQWREPRGPAGPGAAPPLTRSEMMRLATAPHGSLPALVDDAADAAIDALLDWAGGPAWDAAGFASVCERIGGQLERAMTDILRATADVLAAGAKADAAIDALATRSTSPGTDDIVAELRAEREEWLYPNFVMEVTAGHLPDVTRYLTALAVRAERAADRPDRDRERSTEIRQVRRELDTRVAALRPERRADADVAGVYRMLAEYRITVFAQPMRAAIPVSAKRIRAAVEALAD